MLQSVDVIGSVCANAHAYVHVRDSFLVHVDAQYYVVEAHVAVCGMV